VRDQHKNLSKQNSKLTHQNDLIKQTMRARATSSICQRHLISKNPQHGILLNDSDKNRYQEVLTKVQNEKAYRMFEGTTMKDLNGSVLKNDSHIYKNTQKIKKLDNVYRKTYMENLNFHSSSVWSAVENTKPQDANKRERWSQAEKDEQMMIEKEKREEIKRKEKEVQEQNEREKLDKAKKEKDRNEREKNERAEKEKKDKERQEKEAKEKLEKEAKQKEAVKPVQTDLPKDQVKKDVPKEQPKELPKEQPKELPKEKPKEVPKEAPKELPKEQPKEAPKELPKDAPKEAPKEVAKEKPKFDEEF
jgi:hypothetical protein